MMSYLLSCPCYYKVVSSHSCLVSSVLLHMLLMTGDVQYATDAPPALKHMYLCNIQHVQFLHSYNSADQTQVVLADPVAHMYNP